MFYKDDQGHDPGSENGDLTAPPPLESDPELGGTVVEITDVYISGFDSGDEEDIRNLLNYLLLLKSKKRRRKRSAQNNDKFVVDSFLNPCLL